MPHYTNDRGCLYADGDTVVELSAAAEPVEDPLNMGVFVRLRGSEASDRLVLPLGSIAGLARFTACHRYEPYWMRALCGSESSQIPIETQFLLAQRSDGRHTLVAPLIDGAFSCCLQGRADGVIELVAESGDPAARTDQVLGVFVAVGSDPYTLVRDSARSVMARLQTGRLRVDKALPAFADRFGWCTWDAFYAKVTAENVLTGLESFRAGGVQPKLLILDDGWQTVRKMPSGETRLSAFEANEKFPEGLSALVKASKSEYGVEAFLVWHAFHGYWGGVDGESLAGYGVRSAPRTLSPGILHYGDWPLRYWGADIGVVSPDHIYRFFHDYHRYLRLQGIDGVKVDSQASVESVAAGDGGRVAVMRSYHEALEGSVQTHFKGNLINCMSCVREMLYSALNSNFARTSTDYWPTKPASHGIHLFVNAQVSLWFGEFVHPDWDMFQSGHPMGAYHAAGRAVAGCPIYVSDKPDAHDFSLLRKLVLPGGDILRCKQPGLPTRDCLFRDPTTEDVLLKIFNRNEHGGVIGAFHARYGETESDRAPISGSVGPGDVEGLDGDEFAVYAHTMSELRKMKPGATWDITLPPLTAEVFTIMPIHSGFAPIGLIRMFNSGGAIDCVKQGSGGSFEVGLRSGGRFAAYCAKAPAEVRMDGSALGFEYNPADGRLEVEVRGKAPCTIVIG